MATKEEIQAALKAVATTPPEDDALSSEEKTHAQKEGETLSLSMAEVREVTKAEYGCGETWQDCTVQVQRWLMTCKHMKVSNENLGGDPAPKCVKELKVTYLPTITQTVACDAGTMVVYSATRFKKMRAVHNIEEAAFFASMTDDELKGGGAEASGKSGEIFWFTPDGAYVLKTAPENEMYNLLSMLSDYVAYLTDTSDSLLCRYFAAFHFTSKDGGEVRFIVMNNVFQGSKTHVMYDLKGTTEDRWVEEETGGCLKDNNFAPITMYTSDENAEKIRETIKTDTEFLELHTIMDYSLMMAIQYLERDGEKRFHKSFSSLMGGLEGNASRGVLDKASHEPCIFYIGMVDMLVTYNFKKQLAHFLKANTIGHFDKIDTEPPDVYANRFRQYFHSKILGKQEEIEITQVSSDLFESPMPALGRSGGTAAFFKATLKADPPPSKNYWIAKDLARAMDELGFYELAKKAADEEGFELLRWMTEYNGVCTVPCQVKAEGDPEDVQVLLIRNGRDGYKTCRMLDIKIGYATAVAGWQGKSALAAWQQGFVDSATNSVSEGFRLEGFDNPPATLRSFEELVLDDKKFKRLNLQRMTALDFLRLFVDVHDVRESAYAKKCAEHPELSDYASFGGDDALTEVELQELLLLNIIEELAGFVAAARSCPCPQQWIGSSVMLAFDSGARPTREEALSGSAPKRGLARVHIFDWGRSELNTPLHAKRLSEKDYQDREKYWGLYCGGVAKLLFDCCALYVGRYWHEISGLIYMMWDKDRFSEGDFIGKCVMSTDEQTEVAKELSNWGGGPIKAGGVLGIGKKASKLVLSVSSLPLPDSSRLQNGVSTRVHRGENIPNMDAAFCDHTDGYVEVTGLPKHVLDMTKSVQQALHSVSHSTTLCMDSEAPVYEEEFKFASLREESKADFLKAVGIALGVDGPMEEEEMLKAFVNSKSNLEKTSEEAANDFAKLCFPSLNVTTPV